ncbi:hypothetical protein EYF80_033779 [Liparis tanakae]|uniref:Uncharacterized protein n=1 Tax=Liparis tanakae TaxID=230148 RepID=A0A4Z2GTQ4_9TELE|nr:hypothetical protein EYF80_033779 [Liparis tanakae]
MVQLKLEHQQLHSLDDTSSEASPATAFQSVNGKVQMVAQKQFVLRAACRHPTPKLQLGAKKMQVSGRGRDGPTKDNLPRDQKKRCGCQARELPRTSVIRLKNTSPAMQSQNM